MDTDGGWTFNKIDDPMIIAEARKRVSIYSHNFDLSMMDGMHQERRMKVSSERNHVSRILLEDIEGLQNILSTLKDRIVADEDISSNIYWIEEQLPPFQSRLRYYNNLTIEMLELPLDSR